MRRHVQKSGNLFIRLTHHPVCLWQYLILRGDFIYVRPLLFRDENGAAICIRKNSATNREVQRPDWPGDMEINCRRVLTRYSDIRRESSLDYFRSRCLARACVFKATLQCTEGREISACLKNAFPFHRISAFISPTQIDGVQYTRSAPSRIGTRSFATFPIYFFAVVAARPAAFVSLRIDKSEIT